MDAERTDSRMAPSEPTVADIAVDRQVHASGSETLSYAVPRDLAERISVGQLVWVPLRRQIVLGLVVRLHAESVPFELKPIRAPVEPEFCLTDDQLDIARWLARQTATTLFAAASPFFPPGVTHRAVEFLRLVELEMPHADDLPPLQARLFALLSERGEVTEKAARAELGSHAGRAIAALERAGLIERVVQVVDHTPAIRRDRFVRLAVADLGAVAHAPRQRAVVEYLIRRSRLAPTGSDGWVPVRDVLSQAGADQGTLVALARKGLIERIERARERHDRPVPLNAAPPLTEEQSVAWKAIERALVERDSTPILLHGVTGSGKTEVYLRAVAWCLRHGRSAIVLVPEIALASQVVRRFQARFPGRVAVLHSDLPDAERYRTWQAIAQGERTVVVGPRSALFAPVFELGLIVVDEEHDGAYKQEAEPRYHARRLAEEIAARRGAVVVLGSATPAVETSWRADEGEIRRLRLLSRPRPGRATIESSPPLELPSVEIVDMRLELHRERASIISAPLQSLLERTLAAKEQAMLFLNRRGLATVVLCRTCGAVVQCPHCDIPLVYHADRSRLLCHRCNYRTAPVQKCSECGGTLRYFGSGTQRVEQEVRRLFPEATVARWDQDAIRRGGGHERLLARIERGEVDIIVGTQMIAKGLDLPSVTAIGVIHADATLYLPDFRSAERTFQLLTQVAGRAGRRAPGSHVIVQTYAPAHYAIQAASRHDYAAFYAEEIDFRRRHGYPPFTRLIRYLYRHADEERCSAEAEEMARQVGRHARNRGARIDLLGPTPAFVSKIRGQYQWQFVVRAAPDDLDLLLDGLPARPGWTVDVDPQSLL